MLFCSFIAFAAQSRVGTVHEVRRFRGLEALQQVEATFQDKCSLLRSELTGETSAALRATGVAAPPFSNRQRWVENIRLEIAGLMPSV
jgi:hypothetical protein